MQTKIKTRLKTRRAKRMPPPFDLAAAADHMTRPQAATFLTSRGTEISAKTLAQRAASNGGTGPLYRVFNGRAIYHRQDLIDWAQEELSIEDHTVVDLIATRLTDGETRSFRHDTVAPGVENVCPHRRQGDFQPCGVVFAFGGPTGAPDRQKRSSESDFDSAGGVKARPVGSSGGAETRCSRVGIGGAGPTFVLGMLRAPGADGFLRFCP